MHKTKMTNESELLRTLDNIGNYDIRNAPGINYGGPGKETSGLERHHHDIDKNKLNDNVPSEIIVQFETAKNIYLYAWYVYRFFPVAQHQALTCLELALRKRYLDEIPRSYYSRSKQPMLASLLSYAIDKKYINNEGFSAWHNAAMSNARGRYEFEQINKMIEQGLESFEVDYSNIAIIDDDKNFKYVHDLKEGLIKQRNKYAHGSTMLDNFSLGTFRIVSEIINQVYEQ